MKKSKGLLINSIILAVGAVLLIVGTLFVLTPLSEPLRDKVSWDLFVKPITGTPGIPFYLSFGAFGAGSIKPGLFSWISFALLVVTVIVLVISIVLACKKKSGVIAGLLILEASVGYLLFYATSLIDYLDLVTFAEDGFVKGLLIPTAAFANGATAGLFMYEFIIGYLIALVEYIIVFILFFSVRKEFSQAKSEIKNTKEEKEEVVEEKPVLKKRPILLLRGFDFYGEGQKVAEKPTDYPQEDLAKSLTKEDVRDVINQELDRREAEQFRFNKYMDEYNAKHQIAPVVNKEAVAVAGDKDEEPSETPTPVIVTIPTPVKEPKEEKPVEEKPESLTKEEIQQIIREELAAALKDLIPAKEEAPVEEPVEEEPQVIVVKVPRQIIREVPAKEEAPAAEEPKAEEPAVSEVRTEPVVRLEQEPSVASTENLEVSKVEIDEPTVEAPVAEEAHADEAANKAKIERIPFSKRMADADPDLKEKFNILKSLLKSYGLNDRVSSSGDAFRLHRVTYAKINISGKSLKLRLALDPDDYADTKLPVRDGSSKAIYKDIPLVFKVKSNLSLKRAQELIADCMDKHGIEKVDQERPYDWASEIENSVPSEDDDEE